MVRARIPFPNFYDQTFTNGKARQFDLEWTPEMQRSRLLLLSMMLRTRRGVT